MTSTSPGQHIWEEAVAAAAARFTRSAPLRLGGRGSAMSLAQLAEVEKQLKRAVPGIFVRIVPIKVAADVAANRPAVEGKAVYTGGIDQALTTGEIHAAVHCEKDLDGEPDGDVVVTACRLERGNVRDALISRDNLRLDQLPEGAVIGTCAPRRAAQLRALRADLHIRPIKGNIDSRIERLNAPGGSYHALLVSWEGLCRLRMWNAPAEVLDTAVIAPPVGAAVVTVQTRTDDQLVRAVLGALNHAPTDVATRAERTMLADLHGDCASPISGHCVVDRDTGELTLTGKVFSPDGAEAIAYTASGPDPPVLGREVARVLTARGADRLLGAAELNRPG